MKTQVLFPSLRVVVAAVIGCTVALLANVAYSSWTEPGATPPSDNVAAPINVSNVHQSKPANLILNQSITTGKMRSDLYCNEAGDDCFDPADVEPGGGGTPSCALDVVEEVACRTTGFTPPDCASGYTRVSSATAGTCNGGLGDRDPNRIVAHCARVVCS